MAKRIQPHLGRRIVLLEDGPEGKAEEIVSVAYRRADELIAAGKARPATLADFSKVA